MLLSDNVATLIHDLKTPIFAQQRILDLLLKNTFGELSAAQAEIITQIKNSSIYLENIVSNALDSYKLNNDKLILSPESFNLNEVITSSIEQLTPLAQEKGLTLALSLSTCTISADKFHLKRVITNLISNAISYSTQNSQIEVSTKLAQNSLIFSIKNVSPISTDLSQVFDKFYSTSNSGLGLHLVKNIIELHNGNVFAQNPNQNECVFGFTLPQKSSV